MNNDEQKTGSQQNAQKICPHCAERIGAAAKLCPHCRRWQKTWSLYNNNLAGFLWIAIGTAVWLSLIITVNALGPKREFTPYGNDIQILSSSVSSTVWDTNRYLVVVGVLTNKTEFAWQHVQVEVQLFDEAGKLIDTDYSSGATCSILPHAEQAFKLSFKAAHSDEKYSSHKVFVRSARDAREMF